MDNNNSAEATVEVLPCSKGIQTDWQVLVKQYDQVGFLWLDLSPVNPAGYWRVPAQVCCINVQDAWRKNQEYTKKWTNCRSMEGKKKPAPQQ